MRGHHSANPDSVYRTGPSGRLTVELLRRSQSYVHTALLLPSCALVCHGNTACGFAEDRVSSDSAPSNSAPRPRTRLDRRSQLCAGLPREYGVWRLVQLGSQTTHSARPKVSRFSLDRKTGGQTQRLPIRPSPSDYELRTLALGLRTLNPQLAIS